MCLTITIEPFQANAGGLSAIASSMPAALLRFDHERRSWLGRQGPRLRVGCACELLAESADWNAPTHDMTPDAASRLAATLAWITSHYRAPLAVEVVWDGDGIEVEEQVDATALAELARTSRLGTRTRYVVRDYSGPVSA